MKTSTANFSILGGDFNFDPYVNKYRPKTETETTLEDITEIMANAMGNILTPSEVRLVLVIKKHN